MDIVSTAGKVVSTVATDAYVRTIAGVDYTGRMALKVERLLDETIQTLQVARPVMVTVAQALDDGFLDQLTTTMQKIDTATELIAKATDQLDVVLPLIDATAPFTGIVNSGIGQVNNLPGMLRRAMAPRPTAAPPAES